MPGIQYKLYRYTKFQWDIGANKITVILKGLPVVDYMCNNAFYGHRVCKFKTADYKMDETARKY